MNKEETKLLNESLSKLFKLDSEILASLYNEAGDLVNFSVVLDADKDRISKHKSEVDSQYKRGIKEGAEKIEKAVREKFEFESDKLGVDLVEDLILKKVDETKTSSTKDITKHPDYIRREVEFDKEKKALVKEWEQKMESKEKEFASARLFEKVRDKALVALASRNPMLPQDPRKAQTWKDTYLNELRQAKYQENEDGTITVLDKDDTILKNAHGHVVSFDEFEKEIADKYFEYPKAEDRSSSGNKEDKTSRTGVPVGMPRTEEEYFARLKDPKITPAERVEVVKFWTNKDVKK